MQTMMKNKIVVKPLFENVFGENNTIKVLDFFLMGKDFDFTLSQIAIGTDLSRTAVRNAISELLDKKMIVVSREDVKSTYYRINKEDKKFELLTKLYKELKKEVWLEHLV